MIKNCNILNYSSTSINDKNQWEPFVKAEGEELAIDKMTELLQDNFIEMNFETNYIPQWADNVCYDFVSNKYNTIIMCDSTEHYKFLPDIGKFDYKRKRNRDKLQNTLAIRNGFVMIRISIQSIIQNKDYWKDTIFNYLKNIMLGNLKNMFLWIGSDQQSNKIYSEQRNKLYDNKIKQSDIIMVAETEQPNKPDIKISDVIKEICTILNELYPTIKFETMFKPTWLSNKQTFSLGSVEQKIVFTIDYNFFENYFNCNPEEIRKKELQKVVASLKNNYSCVRIHYKLSYDKVYLKNQLKSIIDDIVNEQNTIVTYINTNNEIYNEIYKSFINTVSLYTHKKFKINN